MNRKDIFIQTIKNNEGAIFKITSVYTDSIEDQKDLYQEIVYQLWKSFESFNSKSKISTWIYRVALNTSIAYLNKQKRKVEHMVFDFDLGNIYAEDDYYLEEQIITLYAHIKKLNVIDKGLIFLFLEGNPYSEIAEITGFTTTNVGSRLSRIKQKLKSQVEK